MMVVFGGRSSKQALLNDTWGLRRHRDGRWTWVQAPYKGEYAPMARFQHSSHSMGKLMVVLGGRTGKVE